MRKLYEIDKDIEALIESGIDPETGEVTIDDSVLESLQIEREQKIENVVLYYKDIKAKHIAITHEIMNLEDRAKKLDNTLLSLKEYLAKALDGQKFSTAKVECSFRRSESVEVDESFCQYAYDTAQYDFITHKETDTPNKAKIKAFLKNGGTLEHCKLVEKNNLTVR